MRAKRDEAKARLWAERIAAFERSGLGRRAWCRQAGLNPNTLDYWRARLRPKPGRGLVPIVVSGDAAAEVEIAVGALRLRVRSGTEPAWLAALLRALAC